MTLGESIWELELICLSSPTKPWLFDAWRVWFITCACLHNLMRYGMRLTQNLLAWTYLVYPVWCPCGMIRISWIHSYFEFALMCTMPSTTSEIFLFCDFECRPGTQANAGERLSRRSGQSLVLEGWVPRAGQYESAMCNSQNKNQWTSSS